jgi:DNA-binding winged helix-turn-helix (wHTH) protein
LHKSHVINVSHLNIYANELANRMRHALNLAGGMINVQDCLNVADEVEQIGHHLAQISRQTDENEALNLRDKFNIKHMSAACMLQHLLKYPDMVQSQQDLANTINCSARSIPVYMSHLRHALNVLGLRDVIRVNYRSGYYIAAEDVAKIRDMAVTDDALIAKAA